MSKLSNILVFISSFLIGQNPVIAQSILADSNRIKIIVVDEVSLDPLAYINVYNKINKQGTVTNFEGYFELAFGSANDVIEFSAVGYKTVQEKASELCMKDTLRMRQQVIDLKEFQFIADDPGLVKMILGCKKKSLTKTYNAKTYFELETYVDEKQVELVEIYFNGSFKNHCVDHLSFKEGRIGVARFNQEFFISSDISRTFYSFDLFHPGDHFPKNPFNFPAKDLSKKYRFRLVGRYSDAQNHRIVGIRFLSREETQDIFEGTLWVDSTSSTIQKINLSVKEATTYPFTTIFSNDSIKNVSMDLNVVFENREGEMVINNLNFDYHFRYLSARTSSYEVRSNALLYAYDKNSRFIQPLCDYRYVSDNDYRNVSSSPYNPFFWEYMNEFQLNSERDKNNQFYDQPDVVTSKNQFKNLMDGHKGFFQHPYLFWSQERIRFSPVPDSLQKKTEGLMPSEMYSMGIKLYVDINQKGDSIHVISSTIYDPFHTFFYFPLDNAADCFLNLYFDLVEIKRREFELELNQSIRNLENVTRLYHECNEDLKQITNSFLRDAEHGTNLDGMRKWNQQVKLKLGIDNMSIFGL